jgi:hypothetical protein
MPTDLTIIPNMLIFIISNQCNSTQEGSMKLSTALKKAQNGEFEFLYDAKEGCNEIRYQTPSGKWKEKIIEITFDQQGFKSDRNHMGYGS